MVSEGWFGVDCDRRLPNMQKQLFTCRRFVLSLSANHRFLTPNLTKPNGVRPLPELCFDSELSNK